MDATSPEKAVRKMPAIPLQRAILVYKDQTERLIIESTLSAEGQRFGWIVPVPGKPTEIREASAGLMNTLSIFAAAEVTHDMLDSLPYLLVVPVIVTLWVAHVLLEKQHSKSGLRPTIRLLATITFFVFVASIFLPTLGTSGPSRALVEGAGVHVESSQIVGNYEVALLQADSSEALGLWLDDNGFAALPSQGHAIVSDYIRQNWHFVAAKLQRDGSGMARPHPLSITFASTSAVYPMRLTALAGSPVALELFVVSQQQALAAELEREFCDVLSGDAAHPTRYLGKGTGIATGHPQSQGVLWDGCCLTKLRGTLLPAEMAGDINMRWQVPRSYRQHLYSRQGAWTIGLLVSVCLWTFGAPIALFRARRQAPEGFGSKLVFCLRRAIGPVLAAAIVLGLGTYLLLPKTEVNAFRSLSSRVMFSSFRAGHTSKDLQKTMQSASGMSLDQFRDLYAKGLERDGRDYATANYVTGEPIREEDSPGNYTIREEADKFVVTWFDQEMVGTEVAVAKGGGGETAGR